MTARAAEVLRTLVWCAAAASIGVILGHVLARAVHS